MSSPDPLPSPWSYSESPFSDAVHKVRDSLPTLSSESSDEHSPLLPSGEDLKKDALEIRDHVRAVLNPPLVGGLAAVALGIFGPVRKIVFKGGAGGWVKPVTDSIGKLGGLFTALQM